MSYGLPSGISDIADTGAPHEDIVVRPFVVGEAVAAGDCVRLSVATEASSYTPGKTVMQGDANTVAVGIALTAGAAAGAIIHVQVWGRNQIAIVTGGGQAAGAVSYIGAAGATAEQATWTSLEPENVLGLVGLGLAADASTAGAINSLFICPHGGAW